MWKCQSTRVALSTLWSSREGENNLQAGAVVRVQTMQVKLIHRALKSLVRVYECAEHLVPSVAL